MATRNGTNANNSLTGTSLADRLNGLGGNDTLNGGNGNDTLDGSTGNDRLNGSTGNDFYLITENPGTDTFVDSGGTDTVLSTVTYSIANKAMIEHLTLQGTQAINGTGNEGANTITGNSSHNRLIGNGGSDRLIGGSGNGRDTLEGGAGNDTLDGGNANDSLLGGTGTDSLEGGSGTDTLSGGDHNDTLGGGTGADVLLGGTGKDVFLWDASDALVDGGTGKDTLRLTGSTSLDLADVDTGQLANMDVVALAGNNSLAVTALDISEFFAGARMTVKGEAGDAVVAGGGWTRITDSGGYVRYTQDGATLSVDRDIGRSGIGLAPAASSLSLSGLDGANGFRLIGADADDQSGTSVASAGDVNGDGYADLIIGARYADPGGDSAAGETYVVFGRASGLGSALDLGSLDGTTGFRLDGIDASDHSGIAVASAGDVNGDGFADLIIGAWGGDPGAIGAAGEVYVVFGKASGFGSTLSLDTLNGTNGFRLDGFDSYGNAGRSVASAGDINGDGFDDVLVGAHHAMPYTNAYAGEGYVVFGKASGFGADLDLNALNGANGFRIPGDDAFDIAGRSLSSAGDVNGDGYDDLIIGAYGADPGGDSVAGETYVLFGRASGFGQFVFPEALNGTDGFRLDGIDANDGSGFAVAGAGDVNGDGIADLIISAPFAGSGAGESYVVFGHSDGFGSVLDLASLDGTNGFRLDGINAGDEAGRSVSSAGDLNGDGYDDLIVGAYKADASAGETYVIFGKASGFGSSFDLGSLNGTNGFRLDGIAADDRSGYSVAAAGDLNGDGFSDLIVGARLADGGGDPNAGESYVILGRDWTGIADFIGGTGADSQTGGATGDIFIGGAGSDTMTGGGGADVFRGGAGDDVMAVGDGAFLDVDGGAGTDTLLALGSGLDLVLTGNSRITGIEIIDLSGAGGDTLTLNAAAVASLSNSSSVLRLDGGPDDTVVAGSGWTRLTDEGGYARYTHGGVSLHLDMDMDRSGIGIAPPASLMSLGALDGANGFRVDGAHAYDRSGTSVATAGDINGDGFSDLIIGAGGESANYVVFGKASGFDAVFELSSLDGGNGFRLPGDGSSATGTSVAPAGDVNGDGFVDVIVGAIGADSARGESWVVFGRASGFGASIEFTALNGTDGFRLRGIDANDLSGRAVATAGDVNGDGYADLIVGADQADPGGDSAAGETYVVFGKASGFASVFNLGSLDGANGFRLDGIDANDRSGFSVASAGDINGDGYADLIVGAVQGDPGGASNAGESYVIFGKASGFGSALDLASLNGANGFRLDGIDVNDLSGIAAASAGDVNGDGYADLIIGASSAGVGTDAGQSYVVFGKASGFGSALGLGTLDGTTGFRLDGVDLNDRSGISVASAGDMNGDGYDDMIIGASGGVGVLGYDGETYVVFGSPSGFGSAFSLGSLDGANGFRVEGFDALDYGSTSVASAGDINGDGFADLIIGARQADPDGLDAAGESYVIFGRDFSGAVDFYGGSGADSQTGSAAAESFIGGGGNDTMTGGGGADVFRGAEGDDRIVVADAAFLDLDGGAGSDTLAVTGGLDLDLTAVANTRISGIEIVDLRPGGGANALTVSLGELLALSDTSNTLTIEGGASDSVSVTGGVWTLAEDVGGYDIYTLGAATLRVDTSIGTVNIDVVV